MLVWRCRRCGTEWADPPEDLAREYCPVRVEHVHGWHKERHAPRPVIISLPDDPGALLEAG